MLQTHPTPIFTKKSLKLTQEMSVIITPSKIVRRQDTTEVLIKSHPTAVNESEEPVCGIYRDICFLVIMMEISQLKLLDF